MEKLTKESAEKIMETKGESRGLNIKSNGEFVLKEKGEEGLALLEQKMQELGYPIKYTSVKGMSFYPIGYQILTLLLIKELFRFSDGKIADMGRFQAKFPLVVRMFMGTFFSLEIAVKNVQSLWRRYYTVGSLKIEEFHPDERWGIVSIRNLPMPRIYFKTLDGFFPSVIQMIVKSPVKHQVLKSPYDGDDYYEIKLSW